MKAIRLLAFLVLATSAARADWNDLRPGMDVNSAWRCAGAPMLQSNGRATQQWNYDRGGFIVFERGRVIFWQAPQPVAPPAPALTERRPPRGQPAAPQPDARAKPVAAT